jgi:hypothetical protein
MPRDTGRDILTGLIADLTAIKRLTPKDRIQELQRLLDRSGPDNAESRLASARSHATRDAAAQAGSQTALAKELGITAQRVSTLISGISSRKAAANRRKEQAGAAAGG